MILVDTSILIDALRSQDPKLQQLFVSTGAAICGIALAEVLHGARDAVNFHQLLASLAGFPRLPIPEGLWEKIGQNLYLLRTRGLTIPFPDVVLATVAIENGVELWTRDSQFSLIQPVLPGLKLFQEPP